MASVARVLANRSNAQKSTGPRTAEGKAVVAQNAVRHGLLAQRVVVKGEDPDEFRLYRDRMLDDLGPIGSVEGLLAERIVNLGWRLGRAERLEGAALATLEANAKRRGIGRAEGKADADEETALARVVVEDFGDDKLLDRLLGYERRIENSLYRTMNELRKERLLRSEFRLQAGQESDEVSSLKCQVSSEEEQEAGRLILPTENLTLQTATEVAYGVTTNGTAVEEPIGETKPICRAPEEGQPPCCREEKKVGRGRPTHEEPPGGVGTNGAPGEEPSGETKPIGPAPEEVQGPCGGKEEEIGRGRPTYEEACGVGTNGTQADASRPTKPDDVSGGEHQTPGEPG